MKKFFTLLCLIIFPFISLGQDINDVDITDANNVETNIDVLDNTNEQSEFVGHDENVTEENLMPIGDDNGLGLIGFGFCNEGEDNLSESLNYAISTGQPFKVCTIFRNNANQDINIRIRVVDKLKAEDGHEYCAYDSTGIHNFIDKTTLESFDNILLPAGDYVVKEFDILYPIGVEGDQSACFSYYVLGDEDPNAMLSTIVTRGHTMKFFVGGIDDIKNELEMTDISTFFDDNKDLNLNFTLSNIGNLEDKVTINGTISNIFGFKKTFTVEGAGIQLTPKGSIFIPAVLGSLPSYGGLYKIEFTATATPFFSYDISNSTIDPTLLEQKEFTASTTFFQMPWLIIIIAIVVILLIISIFRKPKEKVVYVNNPQQPIQPQQYQQPVQPQQYQQPVQPQQYQQPVQPQQYQQPIQPQQPTQNQQ